MPRKPTGYYTKGKGPERTVHPTFNPQGLRISKKHSGNTPVMDERLEKRIASQNLTPAEQRVWEHSLEEAKRAWAIRALKHKLKKGGE